MSGWWDEDRQEDGDESWFMYVFLLAVLTLTVVFLVVV